MERSRLLVGDEVMERLARKKVIVFGIGGVGSWCAESLVRSGVKRLTIVDYDKVAQSNINRQAMATHSTVGEHKVYALRQRLLDIAPDAEITAVPKLFNETTKDDFALGEYDYIIDCIDSLKDKILLAVEATRYHAVFFSSMGSALKLDFTRIRIAEFWQVDGYAEAYAAAKDISRQEVPLRLLARSTRQQGQYRSQRCRRRPCPAPQGSDQRHDGSYNGYLRFCPGRTRGAGYRPREVRRVNFLIFIRKEETACISCKQSLPFLYSIT